MSTEPAGGDDTGDGDDLDPRGKVAALLELAEMMEEGPTQIAVCEEAVRLADTASDELAAFYARKELTKAATFGGRPDLSVVAFSWCLAKSDEKPDEYPEADLLWSYKWVTQNIPQFPTISRDQLAALLDDMEKRFRKHDSTLHAVHMIRRDTAVEMHDPAAADAAQAKFAAVKRDRLADCAACVNDGTIDYLLMRGDDAGAVDAAKPAIEGKMTCAEVPHRTYSYVLLPLLRLGRLAEAERCHLAGYRLIRRNPKFVRQKAYHLAFLALTGNRVRAKNVFERHLAEAVQTPSLSYRFEFYAAARLFLDRLDAAGKGDMMLAVPPELRAGGAEKRSAKDLGTWLDGEVRELAAAFDARNGNDGFARRAAWFRDQARFAVDHPIASKAKGD